MLDTISFNEGYRLKRLQYYLNYGVSTSALFFLSFVAGIFFYLSIAAAVIFTPFMLYVLYTEKKRGWLITFLVMILFPLALAVFTGLSSEVGKMILIITLALFYFYCFLLRFTINDWVQDIDAKQRYQLEKIARDQEMKGFMEQFKN